MAFALTAVAINRSSILLFIYQPQRYCLLNNSANAQGTLWIDPNNVKREKIDKPMSRHKL